MIQIQHPKWENPSEEFDNHYTSIVKLYYYVDKLPLGIEDPGKSQAVEKRQCLICDRLDGTEFISEQRDSMGLTIQKRKKTTFKNESHLIPAALGNKKYFSWRECDTCNKDCADLHDDHLAKMLLPTRVIGRVPMRHGHPRALLGTPDSEITWDPKDKALKISIDVESEKESPIQNETDNSFILRFLVQKHRPYNALKSIMRSVWLAMTDEHRMRHSLLRQIFRNEIQIACTEYFAVRLEGELSAVLLECWEKRADSTTSGAMLILRLCIGDTAIIWCLPESGTCLHVPTLLPQFPSGYDGVCDYFCIDHDTERQGTHDMLFTHGGAKKLSDSDQESVSSDIQTQLPKDYPEEILTIQFQTKSHIYRLDGITVMTCQSNYKIDRFKLFGAALTGEITVHHDKKTAKTSFELSFEPDNKPLDEVRNTLKLFTALRTEEGVFSPIDDNGEAILFVCTMTAADKPPFEAIDRCRTQAEVFYQVIDALDFINKNCKSNLFLPKTLSQLDYQKSIYLSKLLSGQQVAMLGGLKFVSLTIADVNRLCEDLISRSNGSPVFGIRQVGFHEILSQQIDIGTIEIRYINSKVIKPLHELVDYCKKISDVSQLIEIEIDCEKEIHSLATTDKSLRKLKFS